ncbi:MULTISPECIES: hypothetical protein [Macromonas]|uniref:hypothetical protein n=1 Tax=Macromonas TaxID=183669 RepID=UPI000C3491DE|nr:MULTISPECIES: hypothetical protein [Macromonas]
MAMLTLNGIVQNVFARPASTDKETGEVRPATDYAQILAENVLESGEKRLDMVTLKVRSIDSFRRFLGQRVSVPVGAFVSGKNILFYSLKTEPEPIPA